ncbi:MAG TPA: ribosome maturation factor RimM [Terriglobales bacterium]|nr:ribosome maturation factor RimM [Terriglobales bacterium]
MGSNHSVSSSEFITLARVFKTQGRHGEVAVELHSDIPDRFHEDLKLSALGKDGARREVLVEDVWPHKGSLVLKFAGIDSMSEAETLIGCELQVPRSERAGLEPGWTYISDLVGCVVFDGSREVGSVRDVQFGAGEAPLLLVGAGNKEHEIPYAEAFLKSVDIERKQIHMQLPEGLLEVNAPLSAEEKLEQQKGNK